jgi:CrcB protein
MKYIILAAGGAIGTVLRYSLSGLTYKVLNGMFPWGTLLVNLIGSFFIGVLWGLFEFQKPFQPLRLKALTFSETGKSNLHYQICS